MFSKALRVSLIASAVLCAAVPAFAQEKGAKVQKFGNWSMGCDPKQPKACLLQQDYVDAKTKAPLLRVDIAMQGNPASPSLRVIAPLGVLLLKPLVINIDGNEPANLPFTTCLPGGCSTVVSLAPQAVERMKSGKQMNFTFTMANQQTVNAAISLKGFNDGLAALSK